MTSKLKNWTVFPETFLRVSVFCVLILASAIKKSTFKTSCLENVVVYVVLYVQSDPAWKHLVITIFDVRSNLSSKLLAVLHPSRSQRTIFYFKKPNYPLKFGLKNLACEIWRMRTAEKCGSNYFPWNSDLSFFDTTGWISSIKILVEYCTYSKRYRINILRLPELWNEKCFYRKCQKNVLLLIFFHRKTSFSSKNLPAKILRWTFKLQRSTPWLCSKKMKFE